MWLCVIGDMAWFTIWFTNRVLKSSEFMAFACFRQVHCLLCNKDRRVSWPTLGSRAWNGAEPQIAVGMFHAACHMYLHSTEIKTRSSRSKKWITRNEVNSIQMAQNDMKFKRLPEIASFISTISQGSRTALSVEQTEMHGKPQKPWGSQSSKAHKLIRQHTQRISTWKWTWSGQGENQRVFFENMVHWDHWVWSIGLPWLILSEATRTRPDPTRPDKIKTLGSEKTRCFFDLLVSLCRFELDVDHFWSHKLYKLIIEIYWNLVNTEAAQDLGWFENFEITKAHIVCDFCPRVESHSATGQGGAVVPNLPGQPKDTQRIWGNKWLDDARRLLCWDRSWQNAVNAVLHCIVFQKQKYPQVTASLRPFGTW